MQNNLSMLVTALCLIMAIIEASHAYAGSRFESNYSCRDSVRRCASSGMRTVEGFEVHRDCWECSYVKTCDYPSKNDCRLYEHCYAVADRDCLLKDSLGNCVNLLREFSCKSWIPQVRENQEARMDLVAKEGEEAVICSGVPCIDGNCVDKSYLTNGEMMDSISKLTAASNMKPDKDYNFNLFPGYGSHCSKKVAGYSNCCPETMKGWGMQIGAKCSKDEISLIKARSKNLCVYVGKENKGVMDVVTKHHYCCFGNMLEKVVQQGAREKLGMNFGHGGHTNCRGLTLEEIKKIDWSRIDFSEFINELMVKFTGTYKRPDPKEIAFSIKNHMNICKYDGDESNPDNKYAGLNMNIGDDSWEAEQERRTEKERLEKERLAKLEAERLEQERLIRMEKEKLAKKTSLEREIATRQRQYDRDFAHWNSLRDDYSKNWREYCAFCKKYPNFKNKPASYYQWSKSSTEYNKLSPQIKNQQQELKRLKSELARLQ